MLIQPTKLGCLTFFVVLTLRAHPSVSSPPSSSETEGEKVRRRVSRKVKKLKTNVIKECSSSKFHFQLVILLWLKEARGENGSSSPTQAYFLFLPPLSWFHTSRYLSFPSQILITHRHKLNLESISIQCNSFLKCITEWGDFSVRVLSHTSFWHNSHAHVACSCWIFSLVQFARCKSDGNLYKCYYWHVM